ncbi:hypothetical protein [Paenibacillus polymyxa]|uniref:hypothetical protein n=1 Tax=Paenibacillus polymyxa TaxID=1406 RepID=UPI002ED0F2C9
MPEQAAELQRSGRIDFQIRDEIKQLLDQAALINATLSLSINQKQPIHNFK